MRIYLDFENVGIHGLYGIENLSDTDCIRIYYSNNPSIDMETAKKLLQSSAKSSFIQLPDSIKKMNLSNAIDIVLLTDISRILPSLGNNYIAVISNDKGFDSVISELNANIGEKRIIRSENIYTSVMNKKTSINLSPNVDISTFNILFCNQLSKYAQYKDTIIEIVNGSKTRSEINNKLNKVLDNNKFKAVMKELKPLIKHLPGQ